MIKPMVPYSKCLTVVHYHHLLGYILGKKFNLDTLRVEGIPYLPIEISWGDITTHRTAIVDSGADCLIFPMSIANANVLNIPLEKFSELYNERGILGIGGTVPTWDLTLQVKVLGLSHECNVKILHTDDDIPYIFGRQPFFDHFQVGFCESKSELYIGEY